MASYRASYRKEEMLAALRDGIKYSTYIYFISDGEFTKIGVATDVAKMMRNHQSSNARKLSLTLSFRGGLPTEQALHHYFARHRVKGEWFRNSPGFERDFVCVRRTVVFGSAAVKVPDRWDSCWHKQGPPKPPESGVWQGPPTLDEALMRAAIVPLLPPYSMEHRL